MSNQSSTSTCTPNCTVDFNLRLLKLTKNSRRADCSHSHATTSQRFCHQMLKRIHDSGEGFPMHSEQAYVLGGSANKGGSAATAAEARSQKKSSPWMPQGPQKLGGDGAVTKWMKPGDAAAAAAAERCLADGKWRLPCTPVVELLLSSSRSQFLVKETRSDCDNSFSCFFSSKES